jgi:hypothetical protein
MTEEQLKALNAKVIKRFRKLLIKLENGRFDEISEMEKMYSAMLALRMCGYNIVEIATTAETAILELTEEDDDSLTTN